MYLLFFLQSAKHTRTVVCDQIANKSLVLLNASILGEYREKPSLRSASHARHQDSVTEGGINKKFNNSNPRMWTKKKVFISKYARIFTISGVNTKKLFISKNARIFTNFGGKPQKKGLYNKICKKQFLLTNSGVITSILGVSGLELHFSRTEPVTFFWVNSRLGGTILTWWAQAVIWGGGARPRNALRGVEPAAKLQ